ncbi:MAG: UbiA family prenyltransferase, partial [Thermoanaerobaculum sp.]|nr:UbiA family prenyltransferase [Thermoanaerobaculum sp.]MDW7967347.1 UbiA family prenyltransferase [Thermoanaerobaculum sp.]
MTGGELGPTACPWRALLHSLRLRQWLKNAFVFAPAVFGLQFADPLALMHVLGAFFAFSLAASGTYLINDVVDREADRANPRTQHRPIARGEVQPATALVTACVLSAAGMALAWLAQALLPLVLYILASHAYSLIFKRVMVLDVVCLASLYVLRLVA